VEEEADSPSPQKISAKLQAELGRVEYIRFADFSMQRWFDWTFKETGTSGELKSEHGRVCCLATFVIVVQRIEVLNAGSCGQNQTVYR
jgi:hypothetical protein